MRILPFLLCGCSTTVGGGVRGVQTSRGDHSVEASFDVGAGLGDSDGAVLAKVEGALGPASGGAQGRIMVGSEWISLRHARGWQLHGGSGISLGAYQSPDLLLEVGGGLHWALDRAQNGATFNVTSIAIDAFLGYAIRNGSGDQPRFTGEGSVFGLMLTLRRDSLDTQKLNFD